MPVTMKMDGDEAGGWMGEVHDGQTLTTHAPEGTTMFHAFLNMLEAHFGIHDQPAADELPVEDIKTEASPPPPPADAPEFHKMPAADLKAMMSEHGEEYVNKQQAAEVLQAKHEEANPVPDDNVA